jgi:hypothetical protein
MITLAKNTPFPFHPENNETINICSACIARMLLHDPKGSHNAVKPTLAGLYGDRVSALKPIAKVTAGRRVTLRAEVCFAQEMAQPAARRAAFGVLLSSGVFGG